MPHEDELVRREGRQRDVPFPGGNRYTIIGENGKFFCRNTPGGCHRVMRAMNNSGVGALAMVGYHPSGAYAIVSDADPTGKAHPVLSSGSKKFSLDTFAANLKTQLEDSTICKYGFVVRYNGAMRAWTSGPKRTAANPPEQVFTTFDWFNPASVTKTVTAVALLHVVDKKGLTIEEKIHKWLPKAWNIPQSIETISVKELLHHTSRHPPERVHVRRASGGGGGGDQHGRQGKRQLQEHQLRARADRHGVPGRAQDQRRRPRHRDGRTVHCVLPDEHLRSAGDPGCRVEAGCGRADRVLPGAAGELGGTSYGDWSLKPGSAGVHLSLAELSIFVEKLATTNILLPQPMRAQMDSEGLGLGKHGSGKGEYYSKGGYFPGSMNGGAELHSAIYKYTNGVQLAIVYNGEGNKSKLDVEKAYDEAWK